MQEDSWGVVEIINIYNWPGEDKDFRCEDA